MAVPAASLAPAYAYSTGSGALAFKAPLLDKLLAVPEEAARRAVVLDLGAPSQPLLDRLSDNRRCRIEIADLRRRQDFAMLNDPDAIADRGPEILQEVLPLPNAETLDLVLCWDLPNYLTLSGLTFLIDVLAERMSPGCRLHMLIAYSRREMAAEPARYVPDPEGGLVQTVQTEEIDRAPRYSPEDLGRAVGGFRYERGVLLANGMQEFVYARPEEPGVDSAFSLS